MVPSEDPRDGRTDPKVTDPETELASGPGGKLAGHQKTLPSAHLTFLMDCTPGKQLSPPAPQLRPPAPRRPLGPVTPPMKTYLVLCGGNQPYHTEEVRAGMSHFTPARETMEPCKATETPAPSPASPLCTQEAPEAKRSPVKMMPVRYTSSGAAKGLLKGLLYSCVCGRGVASSPEDAAGKPVSRSPGPHAREPSSSSPAQPKSPVPKH
ncbi:steroid receptor-associated and regulated protein [Sorex araneus]|uniref:steroid receptor-associated and regulated protein n=1 Tax=Sorex araneus TaxID=42254 RepID=UPI0003314555|nr:steroid receptor-associated and regulated protein [Sorex araneus]